MRKINWLQIAGVVTVVSLVLISLFTLTGVLRRIDFVRGNAIVNLFLLLAATTAATYYISKTNYGVKENKKSEEKEETVKKK